MNIHVHIERLVLDGLPIGAGQASRIRAAVETELAKLFSECEAEGRLHGGALPSVSGGTISFHAEKNGTHELATRIAQSIHSGVVR